MTNIVRLVEHTLANTSVGYGRKEDEVFLTNDLAINIFVVILM